MEVALLHNDKARCLQSLNAVLNSDFSVALVLSEASIISYEHPQTVVEPLAILIFVIRRLYTVGRVTYL